MASKPLVVRSAAAMEPRSRSHLQEMRQDHLGRLRPARQAGDDRRPGLAALRRSRQRPCRQRRLAAQALRPRLNRHRITPTIRTGPRHIPHCSFAGRRCCGGEQQEHRRRRSRCGTRSPRCRPRAAHAPACRPTRRSRRVPGGDVVGVIPQAYTGPGCQRQHRPAYRRHLRQASSRHLVHRQPPGCHRKAASSCPRLSGRTWHAAVDSHPGAGQTALPPASAQAAR